MRGVRRATARAPIRRPTASPRRSPTAENDYLVQGITAGWADVYDWYLPDQYIEVTGVPDGVYILDTIADPDNTILEANESNNCGSVYVRLSNVATSPTAELLGPGPRCKRPTRPRA